MGWWFSKIARWFTTAESFQLYMEGLRSLQLYEEMARESSVDHPAGRTALEERLKDAAGNLGDCVAKYSNDLLPLYYYAILLSTQAQREEAVQLQSYLANLTMPPWPSERAEQLLRQSAAQFQDVIDKSRGEVRRFAQYNLAQVQAKILDPAEWERALKLLRQLQSEDRGWRGVFSWESFLPAVGWILSQIWLFIRSGGPNDGTTGQAASAATAVAERNAFDAQVRMLIDFLLVRLAARGQNLTMADFPVPPSGPDPKATWSQAASHRVLDFRSSSNPENRPVQTSPSPPRCDGEKASRDLFTLIDTLGEKRLPSQAKSDLPADYWNKWSRIALEWAVLPGRSPQEICKLIDLASDYAYAASQEKKLTWTPALLNRAFARTLAGENPQALLTAIVGVEVVAAPKPELKTPDPEEIANYIAKMPLGTPAATIADLVRRAFGPLDAPTLQKLVRALDRAKVKMEMIDEITRSLEVRDEPSILD
jgi:hypothetical protein